MEGMCPTHRIKKCVTFYTQKIVLTDKKFSDSIIVFLASMTYCLVPKVDRSFIQGKSKSFGLCIVLCAFIFSNAALIGSDFTYSYKTVYDSNADLYLVSSSGVRKYTEPFGSPAATYWGPLSNDVEGQITMRFDFSMPTTSINLYAGIASFNFSSGGGSGFGSSSLWGSIDGSNWVLLLDNPVPVSMDSYKSYNQDVPSNLLGSTSFFVQARLNVSGAPNTSYTTAQLSRGNLGGSTDVFRINATIPEPSTYLLLVSGILFVICRSVFKNLNRNVVK